MLKETDLLQLGFNDPDNEYYDYVSKWAKNYYCISEDQTTFLCLDFQDEDEFEGYEHWICSIYDAEENQAVYIKPPETLKELVALIKSISYNELDLSRLN